jgi:hypothetical protein
MKFFTRDLIERVGSPDTAIANHAQDEWEQAVDRYDDYWQSIRPIVPKAMGYIHDHFYLHDAVVRGMGRNGDQFIVVLQLAPPPHDLLTLTYTLTSEPSIDRESLSLEPPPPANHVEWLYDEVDIGGSGSIHTILFSNGWEVQLTFRDLTVTQADALLPLPGMKESLPSLPISPQSA